MSIVAKAIFYAKWQKEITKNVEEIEYLPTTKKRDLQSGF